MQDYKKLVDALRCCASGFCDSERCDYMRMGAYGCMIGLAQDAAAAIEALQDTVQAQDKALKECARQLAKMEPKRGEWVRVEDGESYHYECKRCGERPLYSRYGDVVLSGVCPMCGAKMGGTDADRPD